jgi:hypothetical protein
MQRVIIIFSVAVLLFAGMAPSASAQKNEAGLITAWEQEQKSDPNTTKFEKVSDRRYHFATRRFPFDGDFTVRNVSIHDFDGYEEQEFSTGTVEVELQGVSEDFHRTFATSYGPWGIGNTLYWDSKAQQWLTAEQRIKQTRENFPHSRSFWTTLWTGGWSFVWIIFFLFLLYTLFRNTRRMKEITKRSERSLALTERDVQLSERSVQLQEEHTKLLREMLDELKKKSSSSP